jgi:glycosyltransferase involved in cell wall biosynthesis
MRIGLIAPAWLCVPPRKYGGIESVVDGLARGLAGAGHEVLLAAPAGSTCPVPRVDGRPPAADGCGASEHVVAELSHVIRAYAALGDVDVVHDHTVAGPFCAPRPLRAPVVTTNHGPFVAGLHEVYCAMPEDVALIAISHHQASMAGPVPVRRVIHHGIDTDRIPVGSGAGGYAAFLGRMSPDKGAREAVLIARAAEVPLRLAAKMQDDAERDYFETCVAPLLGPDAEYLGELGEADKYELLGGAVALLNPIQWHEPFGLVMVEALACGTPVVATKAGSAPEVVDDGCTGYTRGTLAELPGALLRAPSLSRATCRQAAVQRFGLQRMVDEHIDLYRQITGVGRRLPAQARAGTGKPLTAG